MLEERALVLNRSWTAISTTSVRRAIVLVVRGAAGVVHPETFGVADWDAWTAAPTEGVPSVRSAECDVPVPEVIVLRHYDGFPSRGVAFTRRNVYRRDSYTCQYCGGRPGIHDLTIDHVVPRSRGGASTWENCVAACRPCNARKANRAAHESDLRLARPPQAPRWPGGLDPTALGARPAWRRFLPESAIALRA